MNFRVLKVLDDLAYQALCVGSSIGPRGATLDGLWLDDPVFRKLKLNSPPGRRGRIRPDTQRRWQRKTGSAE